MEETTFGGRRESQRRVKNSIVSFKEKNSTFENSTSAESRQFNIQNSKINIPIAGVGL